MREAVLHAADDRDGRDQGGRRRRLPAGAASRPRRSPRSRTGSRSTSTRPRTSCGSSAARKGARFLVGLRRRDARRSREHAQAKLAAKGVDLIVANDVSRADIGFDVADNEVVLLDRWGGVVALPRRSKVEVADAHPGPRPGAAPRGARAPARADVTSDPGGARGRRSRALADHLRFQQALGTRDLPLDRRAARRAVLGPPARGGGERRAARSASSPRGATRSSSAPATRRRGS